MTPSDILDLSHWTWTGWRNASSIVSAARLVAGYEEEGALFVRGDSVVFKTPKSGSTTANSSKPRSELREQVVPGRNDVNWPLTGIHTLAATCAVNAVKDKVYIAQIHGKRWNHPVMKLAYVAKEKGIVLDVKQGPNGSDKHYPLGKMKIGKSFRYEVKITDGLLDVFVEGKTKMVHLPALNFSWRYADWYFKCGTYSASAEVAFTELKRSHA